MNLQAVKGASEVTLPGVKVQFVRENSYLKRIIFDVQNGVPGTVTHFEFSVTGYSIEVFKPAEPKTVKKWILTAKFGRYTAEMGRYAIEYDARVAADEAGLTEEQRDIQVADVPEEDADLP